MRGTGNGWSPLTVHILPVIANETDLSDNSLPVWASAIRFRAAVNWSRFSPFGMPWFVTRLLLFQTYTRQCRVSQMPKPINHYRSVCWESNRKVECFSKKAANTRAMAWSEQCLNTADGRKYLATTRFTSIDVLITYDSTLKYLDQSEILYFYPPGQYRRKTCYWVWPRATTVFDNKQLQAKQKEQLFPIQIRHGDHQNLSISCSKKQHGFTAQRITLMMWLQ